MKFQVRYNNKKYKIHKIKMQLIYKPHKKYSTLRNFIMKKKSLNLSKNYFK